MKERNLLHKYIGCNLEKFILNLWHTLMDHCNDDFFSTYSYSFFQLLTRCSFQNIDQNFSIGRTCGMLERLAFLGKKSILRFFNQSKFFLAKCKVFFIVYNCLSLCRGLTFLLYHFRLIFFKFWQIDTLNLFANVRVEVRVLLIF